MRIPLYQVDAFTDRPLRGNPAAVCPLEAWPPDRLLQDIAAENNLSETAFVVREDRDWRLRWFTPTIEVDLCGHATLATAHVLLARSASEEEVRFRTRSGLLTVTRSAHGLTMDFPGLPPEPPREAPEVAATLGAPPLALHPVRAVHGRAYWMAVFADREQVAHLASDLHRLGTALRANVICTAPGGGDVDFVSRFFAPASGVDEDPVTGSSHCTLAPYWASRLGRTLLKARQISRRGGDLVCEVRGDRVLISGRCADYLVGEIDLPEA